MRHCRPRPPKTIICGTNLCDNRVCRRLSCIHRLCCTVSQQTGSTFAQLWLLCRPWLLSLRGAFGSTVAAAHSASVDASSIENGLFSTDCRNKQLNPAVSRPAAHARAVLFCVSWNSQNTQCDVTMHALCRRGAAMHHVALQTVYSYTVTQFP